ncbi:hypothetical protein [Mesorhizobium sp. WSM2561]|uniref:hypothetical protein n=1 Tax=Mesorhizobium sp. WSM2561 TaxID=1040985 RepID=UPI0018DCC6B2|nr:hypothetical protein [Mesorhizobium sp. WSM2561]
MKEMRHHALWGAAVCGRVLVYRQLSRGWLPRPAFLQRLFAVSAVLMLCLGSGNAQDPSFPEPLPAVVEPANITGNWQFIPIPLPERNVTHILVSDKKDRLWIGTPGGVALYDGVEATAPNFLSSELEQPIYVNSLVELADETVLVGTINDSLWLWKNGVIEAVFGACPRSVGTCSRAEWAFAKSDDNRLFVASSSFAPRRTEELNALAARISEKITPVEVSASYLGFAGGKLVSVSNSGTVSLIDTATGKPERELDLDLEPRSFAHAVSFAPGQVVIATTSACLGLDLERGLAPIVLATGYCSSGMMQRDGTSWLSTSRLFRHDIQGWRKWEPEQRVPREPVSLSRMAIPMFGSAPQRDFGVMSILRRTLSSPGSDRVSRRLWLRIVEMPLSAFRAAKFGSFDAI